ncbi:AAA domain-containing protein [Chitinophaga sp. SYP-B3965]|uniref:AAA family ATPase n=1 Tax=Chitinophaga sp. SYP-B3965 TaxID=2663120 RepID=UPI001299F890|nr:MoxR family ATPase [Chitinophaga sp. SYP-B3965]MRG44992.1 AAA domain-containing protein [Chitinophaga sp. SYP-B3965]
MINTISSYTGTALKKAATDLDIQGNEIGIIQPYHANKDIIKAVEYARLLQRPLLLRGEPGCGKTRLAQAVAYEMYGKDYRNYFFEWFVKSTSKSKDGLYSYDHLAQLRDIQAGIKKPKTEYLAYGEIGKAFRTEQQAILLIDEIDKANIDFPNDLLLELDQNRFDIPELDEPGAERVTIRAKVPPLVFITSNDERELPNAFLRRCIFHYIGLDQKEQKQLWIDIVKSHQQSNIEQYMATQPTNYVLHNPLPDGSIEALVSRFSSLVQNMRDGNADKTPDTSELLDWAKILHYYWATDNNGDEESVIEAALKDENKLEYKEVLLKTLNDYKQFAPDKI